MNVSYVRYGAEIITRVFQSFLVDDFGTLCVTRADFVPDVEGLQYNDVFVERESFIHAMRELSVE